MGVGVQGKPGAEVSQHSGHGFHVHPVLQGQRGKCVPLRYNYDKPEKPRRIKGFEVFSLVFHPFPNRKITLKQVELLSCKTRRLTQRHDWRKEQVYELQSTRFNMDSLSNLRWKNKNKGVRGHSSRKVSTLLPKVQERDSD